MYRQQYKCTVTTKGYLLGYYVYLTQLNIIHDAMCVHSYNVIVWTQQKTTKAFSDIKHALAHATLPFHPKLDAPTYIMTDASNIAVGAILQQSIDDHWCPIAFFSTKPKPAET